MCHLRMCPCARSHELRTPVHGMSCASELLVARASIAADSEAAYLLSVVRASCRPGCALASNSAKYSMFSRASAR